jgi:hypothetical protein
MLSRYHRCELKVDEQESEALHDNTYSGADGGGVAHQNPTAQGEYTSHPRESGVGADVHPKQALGPCRSRDVAKVQSVPLERGNRSDHDAPESHLEREVRKERGANASDGDYRDDRRRREHGQRRPDYEPQQMLPFGVKERV